jgi:uncharacterized protein YgiM (DUF1202 family)
MEGHPMRRMTVAAAVVALCCLTALPALGQTMYARFMTPVRTGRALSSPTIGTLQQGEAVEVTGKEDNYLKVLYQGQPGYVYYNKLDTQKPEDVSALLSAEPGGQGLQLSAMEAGGALRGLAPMAENYASAADIPPWAKQAVEQMQARQVTLQEIDAFERAGHLGEYSEGGGQ